MKLNLLHHWITFKGLHPIQDHADYISDLQDFLLTYLTHLKTQENVK